MKICLWHESVLISHDEWSIQTNNPQIMDVYYISGPPIVVSDYTLAPFEYDLNARQACFIQRSPTLIKYTRVIIGLACILTASCNVMLFPWKSSNFSPATIFSTYYLLPAIHDKFLRLFCWSASTNLQKLWGLPTDEKLGSILKKNINRHSICMNSLANSLAQEAFWYSTDSQYGMTQLNGRNSYYYCTAASDLAITTRLYTENKLKKECPSMEEIRFPNEYYELVLYFLDTRRSRKLPNNNRSSGWRGWRISLGPQKGWHLKFIYSIERLLGQKRLRNAYFKLSYPDVTRRNIPYI